MLNMKKMLTVLALSTNLGFAAETVNRVNKSSLMTHAKASTVWHKGSPKAMRGYWQYDLHTDIGGGWGQMSVWKTRTSMQLQGDSTVFIKDNGYKYLGNDEYIIKILAKSLEFSNDINHTFGYRKGTIKVKLSNNNNNFSIIRFFDYPKSYLTYKGSHIEWARTNKVALKYKYWGTN